MNRGVALTPEWMSWYRMQIRCNKPKCHNYNRYGGRGITVCKEWDCFSNFLRDMGHKPTAGHSIERIDNNGNYEPINCRWATAAEQAANRSNNVNVAVYGVTGNVAWWSKVCGVSHNTIRQYAERNNLTVSESVHRYLGRVDPIFSERVLQAAL